MDWSRWPLKRHWRQADLSVYQLKAFEQKGRISNFGRFSFFAGSSKFLADWLVLTWKASFRNCFGWFTLRAPEITYAKNSAFLWRPFVQWQTKETFCFTKCYQPYNYGNLLLLLRWRKRLRRCTGPTWICFIVTPVRNKVGRFFVSFFLSVSLLISKTKTVI